MKFFSRYFESFSVFELVFIAVVSVTIGFGFLGWNIVYGITKPFLKIYGLNYLVSGFWLLPCVLLSGIVRKPGVAIIASVIASSVEGIFAHWGITALLWGFVQGLGAEFVFLLFRYKKWNLLVLILASIASSLLSYGLDYIYYSYNSLDYNLIITQIMSFVLSSIIFAGILANILIVRLLRIGVLNNFKINRDQSV